MRRPPPMQDDSRSDEPDDRAEDLVSELREGLDRAASDAGGAGLGRLFSEVLGRLGSHAGSLSERGFRAAASDVAQEADLDGEERYRDLGFLAKGGMGELRRVEDVRLRRVVASKRMRADALGDDDLPVLRFVDEAQSAPQLEHPGVVPIHDLAVDGDGHLFFTMRLVEGDTLSSALEEH
ncbi:MAG: protein kinase family protein, partial [Planctomycetota bacterium]